MVQTMQKGAKGVSVQIEVISPCEKRLKFSIPDTEVEPHFEKAYKKLQRGAKLKGFRKGKAPISVIKKTYGSSVEGEVFSDVIEDAYRKAVLDHKIRVVGYPKIEDQHYHQGEEFHFTAMVETYPEFELPKLSKVKITDVKVEVKDEDIEQNLKQIQENHSILKELEEPRGVEKGEFAVIDFVGKLPDGTTPESMKASAFSLQIGSNQFIPGFEDQLIGMKVNEEKPVGVTFPKDYHAKEYAGVLVTFDVKLLEIKIKEFPKLDDEFAKTLEYASVDALKKEVVEGIRKGKENEAKGKMRDEAIKKLMEKTEIKIPESMLEGQLKIIREDVGQKLKKQGLNEQKVEEYFTKWKDDLFQQAFTQVKSALILDRIATDQNIEIKDEDLEEHYEQMAKAYQMEMDKIRDSIKKDQTRLSNLKYQIREDKAFEFIMSEIKISGDSKGLGSLFARKK